MMLIQHNVCVIQFYEKYNFKAFSVDITGVIHFCSLDYGLKCFFLCFFK